jgi:hypothetical protein
MKKKFLPLIILANLGVVLCVIGFLVSQNQARVLTDAVSHGLLACYDAATPAKEGVISSDRIREVIRADLDAPAEKTHLLPSFVNANDVYFANHAVAKGSDEIVCAVRVGKARYCAVKGNRASVVLDQSGMDAWAHGQ